MKLEPSAWMVHSGEIWNTPTSPYSDERGEPLFTLPSVLAALRGEIATRKYWTHGTVGAFLAMLDAFEKENK